MIFKLFFLISTMVIIPLAVASGISPSEGAVIVTPGKIEIAANPGEIIRREIMVVSRSNEELNIALHFDNLAAATNSLDGASLAEGQTPIFPLTPYLSTSERDFTLPPGGRAIIPVIIDLPKKISPGGYYGAAVLSITSPSNKGGTRIVTRLTPLLFLRVIGPITETGALIDFNLIGSHLRLSAKQPTFYLTYQNTGTIYLNPYGLIKIKNQITGRQVNLPVDPWFVLPGATRLREIKSPGTLGSGWYQAEVLLKRGYGSSTDQKITNFIIIAPAILSLAGFTVLVGLFVIVRRLIMMKRSGRILLIFLLTGALAGSAPDAWAAVATSTNYRLQSDSLNFGGILSNSTSYKLAETAGEIGSGNLASSNYALLTGYQQMILSSISITAPADVALGTIDNSGVSNGSIAWTVTTDDPAGYTLSIKAGSNPALVSGNNSFSDYAPSGAVPDYDWTVAASASAFGFSPEGADIASRYLNGGSTCGTGAVDTADRCWDGFSTTDRTIAQSSTSNTPSGVATTVKLKAEIGASKTQTIGSYAATLTVTATPR